MKVGEDVIITRIAAGGYHSVAIDHLNRAWTWGWGVHGQLGDGGIENKYVPQLVQTPVSNIFVRIGFSVYIFAEKVKKQVVCFYNIQEKIVHASAGHCHTALLSVTGHVYTFGCSHFGQIGQGLPQKKVKVPTRVSDIPSGVLFRIVEAGLCGTVRNS